jgi:hypothetical protein
MERRLLLPLLLIFLAVRPALAEDEVKVSATLEPAVVGIDEVATLTLESRTDSLSGVGFRPDFELENLEIVGGPYRSEDVRLTNGKVSHSFRMSWRLRPLNTGRARVHSLVLSLPDQTFEMRDREITVQEEPTGQQTEERTATVEDPFERLFGGFRSRRPTREPGVFLRAEISPQRPFVGQQVLYTVYLYTRDDISSMAPRDLPKFRGFWVRDIPLPQSSNPEMVEVDGLRYARVPLLQRALFPLRSGSSVIEPTEVDLVARIFEQRFFGPPISHPQQVRLNTSALTVHVQPLPSAPPPGFTGTVGQYDLEARLEPAELRLGDAATLTVTLSGRGNLQAAREPHIEPAGGLTVYPPQQQSDDRVVGTTIHGERTWSYVVVPDRAGRYELSVPQVPYFDPQSQTYKVASAPALAVQALPRFPAGATGEPHPVRTAPAASSLASLAALTGELTSDSRWLPWLFVLPWAIALAVTFARRNRPAGGGSFGELAPALPGGGGSPSPFRRDGNAMEQRLREAAAESRPRQAAACLENAWRELLAERWDVPLGTPAARWGRMLAERGADPAAIEELVRLAEDLHYLRFAPQLSETGSLVTEAIDRSRRLLRRLR